MAEEEEVPPEKKILLQTDNYSTGDIRSSTATDLTVWAAISANSGEGGLSKWATKNRTRITRFIFVPLRTKGGRMVRPHYCRGDRESTMVFPCLRTLGYLADMGCPKSAKWITPNLRELIAFHSEFSEQWKTKEELMAQWSDPGFLAGLLEDSPHLESVTFATAVTESKVEWKVDCRWNRTLRIPWSMIKLMEIVKRKEDPESCALATLPSDILSCIAVFLAECVLRKQELEEPTESESGKTKGESGEKCMVC